MKALRLTQGYGLIEGPVWDHSQGLLFSDVIHGGVYCLDQDGLTSVVFEHRRGIGGMCLHESGGLVISGRNLAFKAFADGATTTLIDQDPDHGRVGFNDLTTDPAGRIYAGSLGSSPVFEDGLEPRSGHLYLLDLDGQARVVSEDIRLTNGLGFSPNGKYLYHSDSRRGAVLRYTVEQDGSLSDRHSFIEPERGIPDGLVVSTDGRIWVALADGGHGVAVYAANGELTDFIEIDDPMCTSVCFGGDDLKDLYIVSGSHGSSSDRAGGVFRARTEVAGMPVAKARIPLGHYAIPQV
jgi:D-xylonolactonase